MTIDDLDTPSMIVDLDIMERNLERAARYAASHGLRLRPHTKTHKSSEVARQQLAYGASGLTVAKVGEAEVMAPALPGTDLLIAFPLFGLQKIERLREVTRQAPVTVALDSVEAAQQLKGLDVAVLIEIDAGLGRVGVAPGDALPLARAVTEIPGLRFRGLTFYPGHMKRPEPGAIAHLSAEIGQLTAAFRAAGLAPEIVSGGSTPALFHSHQIEALNEIRPGTYVYNDRNTVVSGACSEADCAATILTTVVSTARPGHAMMDGGSKTFSSDPYSGGPDSFGQIPALPQVQFFKMNEEHGFLRNADGLRPGDRVRVIPNHVCVAMNLHARVYGVRGETVEKVWNVEARGRLQ